MGSVSSDGCDLYHEEVGEGVPILLIHPSGATASTWGSAIDELASIGRVIVYDRRGYARSGGAAVRKVSTHTADAAALLESLGAAPAVVVGVSSGAMIAVDLAVRRPDLVRAVIEHEGPWRFTHHLPTGSQIRTFATMGWFVVRGRPSDAAEALLRAAYSYRDGRSAWDAFPEGWRRVGRDSGTAVLWDFLTTIGNHPTAKDLATIRVPVVCSYGARSPDFIARRTRSFAAAIPGARVYRIEGAAHAAPFDATDNFVQLISDTIREGAAARGSERSAITSTAAPAVRS
jgi:pimeloyl-ACP methyl ester carboxylesterase